MVVIMFIFIHPYFQQYFGIFVGDNLVRYIVTEFMSAGSVKLLIHNLGPSQLSMADLLKMAQQAASGMTYLEEEKIIHCDLSLRNLLATADGNGYLVKISDFGLSSANNYDFNDMKRPSMIASSIDLRSFVITLFY
jgi:serine/threonine protein kinase